MIGIEYTESTSIVVVHKPSGIPCLPKRLSTHHHIEKALEDSILYRLCSWNGFVADISWPTGFEGGIAHRLDTATSGQLLVAKTPDVLVDLRREFTEKKLQKHYVFLTQKQVTWREHTVNFSIAHDKKHKKRMVVQRGSHTEHRGKWLPASTFFRIMGTQDGLCLVHATMRTGVMHQIRVHAAITGLALLGDSLYGGGASPSVFPSDFALHHVGICASHFCLEQHMVPVPTWWPKWTREIVQQEIIAEYSRK